MQQKVLYWATRSVWTLSSRILIASSAFYFFCLIQWQVSSHIFCSVLELQLKYVHLFQTRFMMLQDCLDLEVRKMKREEAGQRNKVGKKTVNLKTFKVSRSEDRANLWCFWEKITASSKFQHDWNCFNKEHCESFTASSAVPSWSLR